MENAEKGESEKTGTTAKKSATVRKARRTRIIMNLGNTLLALIIPVVILLSWNTIRRNRNATEGEISATITTVLAVSSAGIEDWIDESLEGLGEIATDKRLNDLFENLIQAVTTGNDDSRIRGEIDLWFSEIHPLAIKGGISLLDKNGIVVGTTIPELGGAVHPTAQYAMESFDDAWTGTPGFVPPIPSEENDGLTSLYFLHPIINSTGETVAMLAMHDSPEGDFSRFQKLGRFGETGKTYTFDSKGMLLSPNRFKDDSPGDNSAFGEHSLRSKGASGDQAGDSMEMLRFIDYQGNEVFRAWTWIEDYDFGMVTEIDVDESMAAFRDLRTNIITLAAITVLLASVMTVINRILGRNALGELQKTMERNLESVFQASPMPLVINDRSNQRILRCNKAFLKDFGITREEAIGSSTYEFMGDDPPSREDIDAAMEAGGEDSDASAKSGRLEMLLKAPDGGERITLASFRNMIYDGSDALITSYLDISDIKAAQRQMTEAREIAENAAKAKSDFLANMSHEIRTPMNAVIGLSHLALQTDLNPKQRDYVDKISLSANNLLGIINDILDFSKIEAGKLSIELTEFDLNDVLQNLASVIGPKAHEKGLIFYFSWDSKIPRSLVGDPLRIGQILLNLAGNAVKFTEHGEIELIIEQVSRSGSDCMLRFGIRDTGIGLKEEQKEKLFEAFNQADTSITRRFGGTGLGLSISRKLTELMGGKIGVESVYGEGSTFWATVALRVSHRDHEKASEVPENLRSTHVLVAGSHEPTLQLMTRFIEDFSMKATGAASVEEALNALAEADRDGDPVKLVIADHYNDGDTGLPLLEKIREHRNEEGTGTILLTDYGREDLNARAEAEGVNMVILKPVTQSALFDAIITAVSGELPSHRQDTSFAYSFRNGSRPRILVVEDNEINQQVARELLEGSGFEVDIAEDGEEAVEKTLTGNFNLVFMDLQMPKMDGYTATSKIRDEGFKDLPIIAMTADAMTGVREKVIESGMNDYVTKPIRTKLLFETLQRYLPNLIRIEVDGPMPGSAGDGETTAGNDPSAWQAMLAYDDALTRVGGKETFLVGLLRTLVRDYGDFTGRFEKALEEDRETGVRLAHSLKGVSANLGAGEISRSALELETRSREGETFAAMKSTAESIDTWIADFAEVFEEWDEAGRAVEVLPEEGEAPPPDEEKLKRLLDLMDSFDPEAGEIFEELKVSLKALDSTKTAEIGRMLEQYDFGTAAELLKDLTGGEE